MQEIECKINLIMFNPHAGTQFIASDMQQVEAFRAIIMQVSSCFPPPRPPPLLLCFLPSLFTSACSHPCVQHTVDHSMYNSDGSCHFVLVCTQCMYMLAPFDTSLQQPILVCEHGACHTEGLEVLVLQRSYSQTFADIIGVANNDQLDC